MTFPSLRLRLLVLRFALLALLFGAVAPSLSSLLADAGDKAWIEVCTAAGTQRIAVDADGAPDDPGHAQSGPHCPYCRLQQDLPAIAHAPAVLVLADGSVPPPPLSAPPAADIAWPAQRSRAPPALS